MDFPLQIDGLKGQHVSQMYRFVDECYYIVDKKSEIGRYPRRLYRREIGADDFGTGSRVSVEFKFAVGSVLWKFIRKINGPYARSSSKVKTTFGIFQRRYVKTSISKQATNVMREVEPVLFGIVVGQEIRAFAILKVVRRTVGKLIRKAEGFSYTYGMVSTAVLILIAHNTRGYRTTPHRLIVPFGAKSRVAADLRCLWPS